MGRKAHGYTTTNPKCLKVLPCTNPHSPAPGQLKAGHLAWWQFIKTLSISEGRPGRMEWNCPCFLFSPLAQPVSCQKSDPSWLRTGQLGRPIPAPELFAGSAGGSLASVPTSRFSCPALLPSLKYSSHSAPLSTLNKRCVRGHTALHPSYTQASIPVCFLGNGPKTERHSEPPRRW